MNSQEYRAWREMVKAIGKVEATKQYNKEKKNVPKISK